MEDQSNRGQADNEVRQAKRALIVFGGSPRPGSLANALEARGFSTTTIEMSEGGATHDLRDPTVTSSLRARVTAGEFSLVWIATPCESFSVLWLEEGKPKLRSRQSPQDWRLAPARWRTYVRQHNQLAWASAELAKAAFLAGCSYVVENPVDRGNRGSKRFEERFANHAPLWVLPAFRQLAELSEPKRVELPMCAFRGEFQKWTSLWAAGPAASHLPVLNCLTCLHSHHRATAKGEDDRGIPLSEKAGEYPTLFSATVAGLLDGCHPSEASLLSALGGPAAGNLHELTRRQREINAEAAQSFMREAEKVFQIGSHPPPREEQLADGEKEESAWRSAKEAIPRAWPEATSLPTLFQAKKAAALRYVSKRRADSESAEELAKRPLPSPAPPYRTDRQEPRKRVGWPADAPARPVQIDQLFLPGVYGQVMQAVAELMEPMAKAAAEIEESADSHPDGRLSFHAGVTRVFKQADCQPAWARECVWNTSDPSDCVPLQPYGVDGDTLQQGADPKFFREWGARLRWRDEEMLSQVAEVGTHGHSHATGDTVVHAHHAGLRQHFRQAFVMVAADTEKGWIDKGRPHLLTVPSRLTPKNVIKQSKWRLDSEGRLYSKTKWRLTSDDSIAAEGSDSRNSTTGDEGLLNPNLPSILALAESVAIVKAQSKRMELGLDDKEIERVALWAIDLTDAYRMLAVARHELWLQGFVWSDGVRIDRRALFGSAHLVQLFQRVSSFVLAVAKVKIREYDSQHPYTGARAAWSTARRAAYNLSGECTAADIYIDDAFGMTCLNQGEELRGSPKGAGHVTVSLHRQAGGEVQLRALVNHSRPQAHLAIIRHTFNQAGWDVGVEKIQLGWSIDLLGFAISSEGEGRVFVPEAKRQGMLVDLAGQIDPAAGDGSVPREEVDTLVGRVSHLAAVAAEGNAYLQPMFAMAKARRRVTVKKALPNGGTRSFKLRVQPRRLHVQGTTDKQRAYQDCLQWWRAAFQSGLSVPLAPRREFPEPGEKGCAFVFTDAAREEGTGHGGFTFISEGAEGGASKVTMLYMAEKWRPHVREHLMADGLSMPAGEAIGAVALIDALASELRNLSHLAIFTDSDATAAALNTGNSHSPQMDCLTRWLGVRHPKLQLLAIHIPGHENSTSDALSRGSWQELLAEAESSGARLRRLRPAGECDELIEHAISLPQRGSRARSRQSTPGPPT